MTPRSVVVVGAGLAGARAAETLRALGFAGRVMVVGEEPTAPYERPALSKEFLAGRRDETSLLLRPPAFWDDREIELHLGERVVAVDASPRRVRTSRGRRLRFDALVLATGARPRRLPGARPVGVHELRTLEDARRLREALVPGARLVVVGAGFVGAEVASTASALGMGVTVVEAAPTPLPRLLAPDVGRMLVDRWRAHGIDVRLGTAVQRLVVGAGGAVDGLCVDGGDVPADVVLVGVGVEAARELVPARLRPGVALAGDVAGSGHWTSAALGGVAAAHRVLGLPATGPSPEYVWSDQFGLRLQVVGVPQPTDTLLLDGDADAFAARYVGRNGTVRAGVFANRPDEAAALRRSLAASALALSA